MLHSFLVKLRMNDDKETDPRKNVVALPERTQPVQWSEAAILNMYDAGERYVSPRDFLVSVTFKLPMPIKEPGKEPLTHVELQGVFSITADGGAAVMIPWGGEPPHEESKHMQLLRQKNSAAIIDREYPPTLLSMADGQFVKEEKMQSRFLQSQEVLNIYFPISEAKKAPSLEENAVDTCLRMNVDLRTKNIQVKPIPVTEKV